jgi:AP-1 complex subunit sigma 1/2
MTFRFLLMMSRHGKVRVAKWFESFTQAEKQRIIRDMMNLVLLRDPNWSNVVDYYNAVAGQRAASSKTNDVQPTVSDAVRLHTTGQYRDRLVYRRYAALYIILCIDAESLATGEANELLALDMIHLLVECLDRYFGNVCELDLIFNFPNVYQIIDDMFMAGEFQESSRDVILHSIRTSDSMAGQERDEKHRA